ncbi:MAG: hypothetical protein JRE23_15760 [Deltaproteobacteria bacterium]|nr:hypothetical protein [Deltaproteobacteria bacterium]
MEDELIETPVAGAPAAPAVDAVAVAMQNIQAIESLGDLFATAGSDTKEAVKACIDSHKYTAGATKESVSAVLLGVVAGIGNADGITTVAQDAVALGEHLPNPEGSSVAVAKTEAEIKAEERKANLDAALTEYKQEEN